MLKRRWPVLLPLSLGFLLVGSATCVAAEPAASAPPPAPSVLVAEKTVVDAGEIVEGAEPVYTFTLVNQGTETLKLQVATSCGCTVAKLDPTIAPSGRAVLEAKLITRGLRGKVTKRISVRTDGASPSRLELQIAATVRPLIRVEPAVAAYLTVKDRGRTSTEFTLTPEPGQGVELTEAASSVPYVQARLSPPRLGGARKLLVSITPDAPLGHLQGVITVATNSTVVPRVNLVITAEKGISVSPRLVFWGLLPDSKAPAREEITLTKHGSRFRIKRVESDDPLIQVKVEPIPPAPKEPGSRYRLVVTYAGGWNTGTVRHNLTVTTDDARQPVLTIPVQAVIASPGAIPTQVPAGTTF